MSNEERLVELEIRVARQDDLVETLNSLVYQQQKKLDELEKICASFAARLRELAINANERASIVDERPPHY